MTIPSGGGAFRKPLDLLSRLISPPEIPLWDRPTRELLEYRCPFCGNIVEGKRCQNCGAPRGEKP